MIADEDAEFLTRTVDQLDRKKREYRMTASRSRFCKRGDHERCHWPRCRCECHPWIKRSRSILTNLLGPNDVDQWIRIDEVRRLVQCELVLSLTYVALLEGRSTWEELEAIFEDYVKKPMPKIAREELDRTMAGFRAARHRDQDVQS